MEKPDTILEYYLRDVVFPLKVFTAQYTYAKLFFCVPYRADFSAELHLNVSHAKISFRNPTSN